MRLKNLEADGFNSAVKGLHFEGGEPDGIEKHITSKLKASEFEMRNDKLALTKDIYSYTFYSFVKNHNPILLGELMIKCFFTIML